FSSRRRHTRFSRDWSSDVCSSDLDAPDAGNVVYRKDITVAFLPQDPILDPKLTVEQTIFASDNPILKVIERYEKALQHPDDADAYQKAFEEMEAHQAWDFETRYKQILFKLNLDIMEMMVGTMSGGQKKRLALASMILNRPDLVIMDEPTNHLDLDMIEWLEEFFRKENFTI